MKQNRSMYKMVNQRTRFAKSAVKLVNRTVIVKFITYNSKQ